MAACGLAVLGALLATASAPAALAAPGAWLDATAPARWNTPGARVPRAPHVEPDAFLEKRCEALVRAADSPADRAVAAAGWRLFGVPQRQGATEVVLGQAGFDGMCRPRVYQAFLFSGGRFAGTLSPRPMESRTDGAVQVPRLTSASDAVAVFARYAPRDPLCCPSRLTTVEFRVESGGKGPVVVATSARTEATSPEPTAPAPTAPPATPVGSAHDEAGGMCAPEPAAASCGPAETAAERCTRSGGTVATQSCCGLVGDFPDTCLVGACGCAPDQSHAVQVCRCPAGRCFDGKACVFGRAPLGGQLR